MRKGALKRLVLVAAALVAALAAYLLLWPTAVDPVAYHPPVKPAMVGALAPNRELERAELLAPGKINGPEDVVIDDAGRVYGGTQEGAIVRVLPDGAVEIFARTGGRPLGLAFDGRGNLIVADAHRGLLAIDPSGKLTVLATEAEGTPFRFTDHLDIAADGTIYFTDASARFPQGEYLYDLLESRPHGRLLRHDPGSGRTEVLLRDLYFANGVALSAAEDFVLVNETYRYRIRRCWLKGPRAGESEIFVDNLPGFPDNITANRRGTFWLALFTVRNDRMDAMHPSALAKKVVSRLPRFLWPQPEPYGLVLALSESGEILRSLHDPGGRRLKEITSAREHGGFLYLGSLHNDRIGRYRLE
jgi:sugar lactone lactonase YvrE